MKRIVCLVVMLAMLVASAEVSDGMWVSCRDVDGALVVYSLVLNQDGAFFNWYEWDDGALGLDLSSAGMWRREGDCVRVVFPGDIEIVLSPVGESYAVGEFYLEGEYVYRHLFQYVINEACMMRN